MFQSNTALYMGGSIAKMYNQMQHGESTFTLEPPSVAHPL
jgi:hypothetical protein